MTTPCFILNCRDLRVIDWLIDWLIHWLIDWSIDWLSKRVIDWLIFLPKVKVNYLFFDLSNHVYRIFCWKFDQTKKWRRPVWFWIARICDGGRKTTESTWQWTGRRLRNSIRKSLNGSPIKRAARFWPPAMEWRWRVSSIKWRTMTCGRPGVRRTTPPARRPWQRPIIIHRSPWPRAPHFKVPTLVGKCRVKSSLHNKHQNKIPKMKFADKVKQTISVNKKIEQTKYMNGSNRTKWERGTNPEEAGMK